LSDVCGVEVRSYATFVDALERQRESFRGMGATATDQSVEEPLTLDLGASEAERIFQRALLGGASSEDDRLFSAHMMMECARMSVDDGLVMQVHAGPIRNYDDVILNSFGRDRGFDIPRATEFSNNLRPLLNRFGRNRRLTLIVFTLDESTYSRELAPLAGVYPALRLGPAWWFHDSVEGMERYRRAVVETAGLHNTVGFNDDTRAFPSIPARHDVARRVDANWLAGLVVRGLIDEQDAEEMALDMAYRLAKRAYKLDRVSGGVS
jgi:glucuronate isomerase